MPTTLTMPLVGCRAAWGDAHAGCSGTSEHSKCGTTRLILSRCKQCSSWTLDTSPTRTTAIRILRRPAQHHCCRPRHSQAHRPLHSAQGPVVRNVAALARVQVVPVRVPPTLHSLFTYFNHLVEQYQKVISPSPALLDNVKLGAYGTTDTTVIAQQRTKSSLGAGKGGARPRILDAVKARADWERYTRDKRKKADEDQEKQRQAFNEIDWQDFVVVGTVELTEADQHIDLPPPRSLREMRA